MTYVPHEHVFGPLATVGLALLVIGLRRRKPPLVLAGVAALAADQLAPPVRAYNQRLARRFGQP